MSMAKRTHTHTQSEWVGDLRFAICCFLLLGGLLY